MNEKTRRERLKKISEFYETEVLEIPGKARKAYETNKSKVVAGQIRKDKGTLVEKIAKDLVDLACEDLKISKDRYSCLTGFVDIGIVNTNYVRSRNLSKEPEEYIYKLEVDNIFAVDGKPIMNIESKSYAEATMLKAVLYNAKMIHNYYPDTAFVLLQLENALGEDYADNRLKCKGSDSAHVIMSYSPDVYLNILTLLDGHRSSSKPIHMEENYKPMSTFKIRKAYSTIKKLISERVQDNKVFSQKRAYSYNYTNDSIHKVIRKRVRKIGV